ncbi:ABC transporter ATP-binding protein/permease [Mycobacterium parmense]|uniref:Vitamin B12 transport ATP-binding protein BacA n=1 Tax=Mycobacterium parmense TaxID=185642 RepID=A0A7I7YX86_9MYCO|nr:ABC transporter ATP-binding protein/permease [Mycobacterium parmense]MCV7349990.1 ABC transporter ATP-binding protein/permease [Mycobacterium parmense]ORW59271.1 multidrug ABC transporter ATP-binding protein [Mycobacterium parmense]BBZ46478.1 vitamin B12 transport ATP-binding protein BacA [Mycobacterium parmense]
MNTYRPSINWGDELVGSLVWVASVWAISALCFLLVAVLIARYTVWGAQFWRITGDYFRGAGSLPVWGTLLGLLALVVVAVRIEVLLSYYNNDLYSSLQIAFQGAAAGNAAARNAGIHGFWVAIATFCVIATVHVVRAVVDQYVLQRFIIRWRVWLTDRLVGDWLTGRAYYRGRFIDHTIDNPDQRIQQDIDIFTAGVGPGPDRPGFRTVNTLAFGSVEAVLTVAAFGGILWRLSGPLALFGVSIPRAMFWIVIAYVLGATVVSFFIGHPLIRLSFRNELYNAAFRFALVRLRDSAEAIGLYGGETAEKTYLANRFSAIIENFRRYVRRTVGFMAFNAAVTQTINPLPFVLQAPRVFAGAIRLGDVTQSMRAFIAVQDSLSFFRNSYDSFASYRASILRLNGLIDANRKARDLPELTSGVSDDGALQLSGVEVRTPAGVQLIDPVELRLQAGESLAVVGPSGSGKSTLLRSLAQLWPFASGTVRRPGAEATDVMFVSQLPYVPLGTLRAVVSYPAAAGDFADDALRAALTKVALGHLTDCLDQVEDWAKVLSPGEQQRIAFARIALFRPKAVFLDESTSALDEGQEYALYEMLRADEPDLIVVSVAHRRNVVRRHDRFLHLLGGGAWRLGDIDEWREATPAASGAAD